MMAHFLAFAAAGLYALAALLIKRSSDLRAGPLRTLLVCNLVCAAAFLPLWGFGGTIHAELWWQPVLVGLCFIAGQWLTFLSLHHGDVSVATPVLGIKIIMVAAFVTLLARESLSPALWSAAALATVGIAVLNRRHAGSHHHVGLTIVIAMLAAAAYALFDVLVQMWSPKWGLGRFLPIAIGVSGVLSLVLIPRLEKIPSEHRRAAWRWLWAGAAAIGGQSLLIVCTIAHWGRAAEANVIYSSRGLWSILLIWWVGHWFGSREKDHHFSVLVWRFVGALLMLLAIVLVLM